VRLINDLHRIAIAARWPLLRSQARIPWPMDDHCENLLVPASGRDRSEGKVLLLELSQRDRKRLGVACWTGLFRRISELDARVLLLLDRPCPELFRETVPENLFIYHPPAYHPRHESPPFRRYLQLRWRPTPLTLDEIKMV